MSRSVRDPDYRLRTDTTVCEASDRNTRAAYELRGMATEWRVDVPRILQILQGDCNHEGDNNVQPDQATPTT